VLPLSLYTNCQGLVSRKEGPVLPPQYEGVVGYAPSKCATAMSEEKPHRRSLSLCTLNSQPTEPGAGSTPFRKAFPRHSLVEIIHERTNVQREKK
jgi:hypothetical protein